MTRFLFQLFALFAIFFAETANASVRDLGAPAASRLVARPDFAFRGMARVEHDYLLTPDGSLYHPKLGLPLNGLRSRQLGLALNEKTIDGLDTKTKMAIVAPALYLAGPSGWVVIGAGTGGAEAWGSVGNYLATGESNYGAGDAALALIGMVPFGAWSSTPNFAAAAAKAGAIGSKGLAGARASINASRLAKAINCGPVARGLARNGWITTRCFPGDTLASGKRMDQYHVDDSLTAWDDAKKAFVQARITQIFVHEHDGEFAEVTLTSGTTLKPTAEHPFRLAQPEQLGPRSAVVFDAPQEGSYIEARYLRTGDLLLTPKGAIAVASVRVYHDKIKVYNFEVEGLHNYTVGEDGVVVHNACLTARVGSKAERFAKARLKNMGFTNIRSIQNSSKHGLDIIAEHPGHLSKYFHFEVKGNAAASRIRLGSLQRQFTTGNQYAMNRLVNLQSQNHGLATTVLADITGGTHSIRSSIINVYQLGRGRRISKDVKWMIKSW